MSGFVIKNGTIGAQLRSWREQRGLSQLDAALAAEVSARHLSFVETGRSQPGRELIVRLLDQFDVPLRQRNDLLIAAGFAPMFSHRSFSDPSFDHVRSILDVTLERHRPFPAYVVDRYWNVVASNRAIPELYLGVADRLMRQPLNVMRILLHPEGLGKRLLNRAEWRNHLLARLRRQLQATSDPLLKALLDEVLTYANGGEHDHDAPNSHEVAIPIHVMTTIGKLSFISATMVFGTPADVTLEEIALEMLFPADAATESLVREHDRGAQ